VANSKYFASASHDHSVFVWDLSTKSLLTQLKFPATCEALCFLSESQLLIGVRESNLLRLLDLADLDSLSTLNLNAFGDDHVSFSVLDVAPCPADSQLVAIASDRDRVFMYWISKNRCQLVATLTGANSDSLSAARCCFSPCGTLL
jgi:WD40 repeat protein